MTKSNKPSDEIIDEENQSINKQKECVEDEECNQDEYLPNFEFEEENVEQEE